MEGNYSFPAFLYHPTDGEAICGTSMELRDGVIPAPGKDIQIESEKIEFSVSSSQLVLNDSDDIILPEIFVEVEYLVRNLTDKEANIEFGFPIMHGLPGFNLLAITSDGKEVPSLLLDHDRLTKVICEQAELKITGNIKLYSELNEIVDALSVSVDYQESNKLKVKLSDWAEKKLHFNKHKAVLLSEYFFLKGIYKSGEKNLSFYEYLRKGIDIFKVADLHTKIVEGFEGETGLSYERFFKLWGGDERSLSVDTQTKQLRPRENSLEHLPFLSAIYGRRAYMSSRKYTAGRERQSLGVIENVLNLTPYSFPPMGLVKYWVKFAPQGLQRIRIKYRQIMSIDIKDNKVSAQFQYILKPSKENRQHQGGEIIAKVPKENNLSIFPNFEIKPAEDESSGIYKATFKNNNSNIYIGINAL